MTDKYPRDIDDLDLTNHGKMKMKDRNIGAHEVIQAVETGEIDTEFPSKDHQIAYILDFPGPDLVVIVDPDRSNIVSVFYDDNTGSEGGALGDRRYEKVINFNSKLL